MTLRLETFGGLSLTDGDGKGRNVQRRRLAVLAMLAVADERGLSRDHLVACLWPEASEDSARHSLEQLLYELRRSIADDLFLGVNPIRINPAVLQVAVAQFESALASGAAADAVALYRGPFLDGFYLTDAPEFERWATRERSRLAGRYAAALDQLAQAAEIAGDFGVAVEWRRRLVSLDPLSAPRALALVRALAAAGDSAGALNHARTYESLVRLELDATPDESITRYVRSLRDAMTTRGAHTNAPATAVATPAFPARTDSAGPRPAATDAAPTKPEVTPIVTEGRASMPNAVRIDASQPALRLPGRWARVVITGLTAGLVLVVAGASLFQAFSRRSTTEPDQSRVAVFPAHVTGSDSTILNLAEGVMDLLAAALTGDGLPAAVDSRATLSAWRRATSASGKRFTIDEARQVARSLNAGTALLTEIAWLGAGQLRLVARLLSVDDGTEQARAEQRGEVDSLTFMVDALVAELLLRQAGDEHLRLATLTSRSLPALAEFLKGRAEHRRGHSAAAIGHFGRALAFDSTFALAALELAFAHGWTLRWTTRARDTVAQTMPLGASARFVPTAAARDVWEHAMHVAWTERDRLSVRDRALLDAVRGPQFPRHSYAREFLAAWDKAVRAAPDRADVLYSLGDLLMHQGAALGLAEPLARAAASFHRALELDSGFVAPLAGLLELAAFDRNEVEVRRFAALYFARDSVGAQADYVRWRVASLTGDATVLHNMRARFTALDLETLARIQTTSQMAGVAVDDANRANNAILRRASEGTQRQIALHDAFWLALNRGRPAAALGILAQKRDVDPNDDLRLAHSLRGAMFGDGDFAAGAESARILESRIGWPPHSAGRPPLATERLAQGIFSVALWRLWYGDTTGAVEAITRLRSSSSRRAGTLELLETLLASYARPRDVPRALQHLDSIAMLGCCTLPHFINFVSARVHERAGDLPRALAAIRRGRWWFPPEYLASYLREEGRLADLTGEREGAIRAFRHYLVLRADPEPVLRPQADSVRRALMRLEASR